MYSKIPNMALNYMLVRTTIIVVILLLICLVLIQSFSLSYLYLLILLVIAILLYLLTYLEFKFYGYIIESDQITIRSGYVIRKHVYMPISRIQQIEVEANFLERLLGIASIYFINAGSKTQIKYLKYKSAQSIRKKLIDYIEVNDEI